MAEKLAPARTYASTVAAAAVFVGGGVIAACSLFVPLDGIEDGAPLVDGGDAAATDGAAIDAPADVRDASAPDVDGGSDATSEGGCPAGGGPPMVDVGGYCVDSTEVTRAQYNQFLQSTPSTSGQLPECAWNVSYLPTPFDLSEPNLPVVYVDWCDAYAFCKWAGKRLCGKIGGGALPFSGGATDSTQAQWYRACSKEGTQLYPYGNVYDPTACNGAEDGGVLSAVKSFPKCEGGYKGLFDMSGNVEEWQDSCSGTTGANDDCRDQAGAFDYFSPAAKSTQCNAIDSDPRSARVAGVGIRCCGP
jgi:formylglycine-generating enzyme required for sulfatase activity